MGVVLTALSLVLGCSGTDGAKGPTGSQGAPGADGPAGPKGDTGPAGADGKTPALKSSISGTVKDEAGAALKGVTITASPGTATATTDASGAFKLDAMDVGAYILTFSLTGYFDQIVTVAVNVSGPSKVDVTMGVDISKGTPPAITLSEQLNVGYNAAVTVQATATGTGTLTYKWTQTGGPTVTLTGDTTDTLGFTTHPFDHMMGDRVAENARFGVLGINPDKAGAYAFEVAVTDGDGRVSKSTVTVNSTRPTSGLRNVPTGIPVWLQGDGALVSATQTTWNWTLDKTGASGSNAALVNPTSQFPNFTLDVVGIYKVKETVSNKTLTVYAGTWLGAMNATMTVPSTGGCDNCHTGAIAPDVWSTWSGTAHATALQRKIEGSAGSHFTEECLSCHTVGYDKFADNKGFDDVEGASGWTYPTTLQAGNWNTLVTNAKVGPLAGIQCENCHGPQTGPTGGPHTTSVPPKVDDTAARISWSSDVCAACHQEEPFHYKPAQWEEGKHASLELAYVDATIETRGTTAAHCGRCHTAQGYSQYVKQLYQGEFGNLTSDGKPVTKDAGGNQTNAATIASLTKLGLTQAVVQSQTCQACHDPHDATNPFQLRAYDNIPGLPNGQGAIANAGTGMICMTCHNSRNGEHSDWVAKANTSFSASHKADQTDVMYGFNAYFMPRYSPSAHLAVKDSCAGCHVQVATAADKAAKQTSNHSFKADTTICAACHADGVNGEALQGAYQLQLDSLGAMISVKIMNLINAELTANNDYTVRVWDPATDFYSSVNATSPATPVSNVHLQVAPTSIEHFEVHGQVGFILHMPAPVQNIPFVDAAGNSAPSQAIKDIYVQGGNLRKTNGTTPLFTASSDYMKSLWNYWLLEHDGTKGIHNPGFYTAVIGATMPKVAALP